MPRIVTEKYCGLRWIWNSPFRWWRITALVVLVIAVALGGAACYVVSDLTHPGEQTAYFMLPDTDGYVTFNLKPGLGQSLEFKRFLDSFLTDPFIKSQLQDLAGQFEDDWGIDFEADVLPWLGPEVAVGTAFGPDAFTNGPEVLVLVGTSDEPATQVLLDEWLQTRVTREGISLGNDTYRSVDIALVNPGDPTECYAVTDGYGLGFYGGDVTRLHSTIDLLKDGGPSLWDNADFQQARSNLAPERMGMGWVDAGHLLAVLGDTLDDPPAIALFNALSPYASSFASFSLSFANKGLELHVYSPTAEGWDFAVDISNPLAAVNLVPRDALGCYADHNMPSWWQEIMEKREELAQNEEWDEILEQSFNVTAVEERYGFDFENDVFGWMTGEYAIAALPNWGNLFGAGPDALVLFEFGNQTHVETSINTIIAGINNSGDATLQVSHTTIAGVNATLVDFQSPPDLDSLMLGYLFLDNFFVVGTSEVALEAAVDAYQHPELSLAQSPKYQRMSALLPASKTGLFYADPPHIANFILSIPDASPYGRRLYSEYYAPFVEPLQGSAFSYLVGADDSTFTLEFHVERVLTSHEPYPNPDSDEQVAVQAQIFGNTTVQQAELVWSADGVPQSDLDMYDDGAHGDEGADDGIYGVQIGPFTASTVVEYQVKVTDVDNDIILAPNYPVSFQSLQPLPSTSDILLVVDDTDPHMVEYFAPYFTASLEALSLSYDFWDASLRGVPEQNELAAYLEGVVVWGESRYTPGGYLTHHLTKQDALAVLASYLDTGGALLLCGNDVATDLESDAFLADYAHATYVRDYVRLYGVQGVSGDPIGDGLDFAVDAWSADEVDPIPPAVTVFTYDPSATHLMASKDAPKLSSDMPEQAVGGSTDGSQGESPAVQKLAVEGVVSSGTAALRVDTGTYKLVFLAFGFEQIESAANRHITMERALTWLAPNVTEYAVPLLLSPADGSTVEVGDVTFEWWEKASAAGYHIQIDTAHTFDSPDLTEAEVVDTHYTAALAVGPHYWRVKAHLNGEDTAYSPTWRLNVAEPVVQITTHPGADADPAITQTADGKVWVVYERYDEVWYRTSADGGSTWSDAHELVGGLWEAWHPAIAQTDDGTVWTLFCSDSSGDADIWYRTSSDGGTTWSVTSQITTHPNEDECPAIAQTDDGTIWVVWESERSGNADIWYKTSPDGGTTWSEALQLTDHAAGDVRPAIVQTDDGTIWVVWQRYGGIYRRTSADGGESWTAALYVAAGASPVIAQTLDGRLWLGLEGSNDIWYMSSEDGGDTWMGQMQFTRFVCEDERPGVAPLSTGQLALAWVSDRSGNDDIWYGVIGQMEDVNPPPCCKWVGHEPPNPDTQHTVTVRAEAEDESGVHSVELVWWVDSVPQSDRTMYDDGNHDDYVAGDGVYGVEIGPFAIPGIFVEYQVQVTDIDGNSVSCPQNRRCFEVVEPFTTTEDILVVDDGSSWAVDYFTDTLDSLGYGYDYWDSDLRGRIYGDVLSQYTDAVVIWASPYSGGYIRDGETQDDLASYLDNGGGLFISGQDIGYMIGYTDFYHDYLHAEYVLDDTNLYSLFGTDGDPISDGLYVFISGGDGANNQSWPSEIDPLPPAVAVFTYDELPTPGPDTIPPTLLSTTWVDCDADGTINAGDELVFNFSESMDADTLDTVGEVNDRLDSTGAGMWDYGSTNASLAWNASDTALTFTLGEEETVTGGETVNPSAAVTDKSGNPDATAAPGPAVPLPPDMEAPSLVDVTWLDYDEDGLINAGDDLVFHFSETMHQTTITPANVDANLPTAPARSYGTTGLTLVWGAGDTSLTITLATEESITGGETVNPAAVVTDAKGNPDQTAVSPAIPLPPDSIGPVLLSIGWTDTDGDTLITQGDILVFSFSESMDYSTITAGNVNTVLDSSAVGYGDYGTAPVVNWNAPMYTQCSVTLDFDHNIEGGEAVNPTAAVTDRKGNSDATAGGVPVIPTSPTPVNQEGTPPSLVSITWYDSNDPVGEINTGDELIFNFSEAMDSTAITAANVNTVLDSSAVGLGDYGTTHMAVVWDATDCWLMVVLGDEETISGGEVVNPTSAATDAAGNPDNTAAPGPAIPLPPDFTNPALLSTTWVDNDADDTIDVNDQLVFNFSEAMDMSTITAGTIDADLPTSPSRSYGTVVPVDLVWSHGNTRLVLALPTDEAISGGETVNPAATVTDAKGNFDETIVSPRIPIPPDTTPPVLNYITWYDVDGSGFIDQGDTLVFNFSEAMDDTTVTVATVDVRLDSTAAEVADYGTAPAVAWNAPTYTQCTVTLDFDENIDGGETVNPTPAVTDRKGNPDATAGGGPTIPTTPSFASAPMAGTTQPQSGIPQEVARGEADATYAQHAPSEMHAQPMSLDCLPVAGQTATEGIQSSGAGALRVDTGTYKVVYFAFGFEAINTAEDRETVMERVIQWLSGTHWSVPMTAETDTEGANPYLEFGATSGATDDYDSGVDVPHAPPGPSATFDAHFDIDDAPFSELDKDYRGPADGIQWTLHMEADIDDITLTWDSSGIPSYLCVYMDMGTGVIDMKSQSSITLPAGQYSIPILVARETDIALVAGWNMVSMPVIPADPSVDSVFPGAELVCGWDRENQAYIYSPTEVEPGQGYWVAMLEDTVVTVCGMPVYEWTGDVVAPWNMIGSVAGDVQVTDWHDAPGGGVEPYAWWWNPTAHAYDFFTLPATIGSAKAYWIAATGDCTLTLP